MRYRPKTSWIEYIAVSFPAIDGITRLRRHPSHLMQGAWPHWHLQYANILNYGFLLLPLLIVLRHYLCYVDLTDCSLEYRAFWRSRSIRYVEIENIVPKKAQHSYVNTAVELYGSSIAKLTLSIPDSMYSEFLDELQKYAPQAFLKEAAI